MADPDVVTEALAERTEIAPNATRDGVAEYLRQEAEGLEDWLDPTGARVLNLAADVLEGYRTNEGQEEPEP